MKRVVGDAARSVGRSAYRLVYGVPAVPADRVPGALPDIDEGYRGAPSHRVSVRQVKRGPMCITIGCIEDAEGFCNYCGGALSAAS